MDWNNGTIFRCFIRSDDPVVNAKVDIGQQELNNKVFIGIENYVLKPNVEDAEPNKAAFLQDYWAAASYIQLESFQLPPYIDFSSQNIGTTEEINANSRNTTIFARLPLIARPTLGNSQLTTEATFASDRTLNKDSILYEMINNPHALSNGRLNFRLLDDSGQIVPSTFSDGTPLDFIRSFSFTLVIYKPSNKYN
jgi:hypothetical protein